MSEERCCKAADKLEHAEDQVRDLKHLATKYAGWHPDRSAEGPSAALEQHLINYDEMPVSLHKDYVVKLITHLHMLQLAGRGLCVDQASGIGFGCATCTEIMELSELAAHVKDTTS